MIAPPANPLTIPPNRLTSYISNLASQLRRNSLERQRIRDECWAIYRGAPPATDKEDWQAKIVLPKAWNAIEQAVSAIRRLIDFNREPWRVVAINPLYTAQAERLTRLVSLFLEKADFSTHFFEGLKIAFITGIGIWKVWWDFRPRPKIAVQNNEIVRAEFLEGSLRIKAVDPNAFFWLPGSTFNDWIGTLEIHEVPKHLLSRTLGIDPAIVASLPESRIDPSLKSTTTRFGVTPHTPPLPTVTLYEYFGPIILDGQVVEEAAHVITAGDHLLRATRNGLWHQRPPYVAMSPLKYPLRDDGVGLIEMNRSLLTSLNEIMNMSVDMLLYRLLPIFEVNPLFYDNPEDLQKILRPGTVLSKSQSGINAPGINAIQFPDISSGTMAVMAAIDRAIQEGSLVSEIQQAIPRWRGIQTATEVSLKAANQQSFFGSLASEIEEHAIKPIISLAIDTIIQFLVSSSDPRVPEILGVDAITFATMPREELVAMINGDFDIKVAGVAEQLNATESAQALLELLQVLSSNPQAWLPYLNQSAILNRLLRAFNFRIDDLHDIIEPAPAAQEKMARLQQLEVDRAILKQLPALLDHLRAAAQQAPPATPAPPEEVTPPTPPESIPVPPIPPEGSNG